MKILSCLLVAFITGICSSCSTIITGTTENIAFNTDPEGIFVEVNGLNRGVTPCNIDLKKKENNTVILKKEGYKNVYVPLGRDFEPVFLGNIIFGGPIGMIVDLCTGSVYKISPRQNFVVMQKITE